MWWTLNAFDFSVFLMKTTRSLVKQELILLFLFNFLPQNALDSFAQVKFSLIKILFFRLKLYFISLLILIRFFQCTNAFLQYLQLIKLAMFILPKNLHIQEFIFHRSNINFQTWNLILYVLHFVHSILKSQLLFASGIMIMNNWDFASI